jgi:hypothetical protein
MAATMEPTRITSKQTLISESCAYASFGAPFGSTEDNTGAAAAIPSMNGPAWKKSGWTSWTMLLRMIPGIYVKKDHLT